MPRKTMWLGYGVVLLGLVGLGAGFVAHASPGMHARYVSALMLAGSGDIPAPCTLTTEASYTLPTPPPLLIESLTADPFPFENTPQYLHLWYRVIQRNPDSTDDRLEIRVNGVTASTLEELSPNPLGWDKLTISLADPGDQVQVELRMTTRAGAPSPTLLFIGAVEISDEDLDAPTRPDSLDYFEYSSNLGAFQAMAAMGVINLRQLNVAPLLPSPLLPDAATQHYLGRLGGVGMPYMAVNLCAPRQRQDDFVEVIFEMDVLYEDSLNKSRLSVIQDLTDECDTCVRYHYTIPSHLLNSAGRPRLWVHIEAPGSRVVADDFTLSYIDRMLYDWYPDIALALSWIPNGGFESGLYPYVIEPGPDECPELNQVIVPTPDACRGARAAVFELPVVPGDACPEGSIYNQPPSHPDDDGRMAHRSNSADGFIYERVRSIDDIRMIEWWGLWFAEDPDDSDARIACAPPAAGEGLRVRVAQNTPELSDAAADALSWIPGALYREDTGLVVSFQNTNDAPLYRYTFIPNESFALMNGWLSVQQTVTDDTTCFFYWMNSPFGDRIAKTWVGVGDTGTDRADNMSLCLLGGPDFDPAIFGCSVSHDIVGRGVTATLTLYGQNLRLLEAIVMAPEMPLPETPGDPMDPERSITLMSRLSENPFQDVSITGRLGERISVRFRFNEPFNRADEGNVICTDGRAAFYAAIGGEMALVGPQDCSVLIDTIPPQLIIEDNPSNDAFAGPLPIIRVTRAVYDGMPATWIPGQPMPLTPKNNRLYRERDMHLYVNPGARRDVPYSQALEPNDILEMVLQAHFVDPYPDDGNYMYPVEIAGFNTFSADEFDNPSPYVYLQGIDGVNRASARWNGSPRPLVVGGYQQSIVPRIDGQLLDARWHVASIPGTHTAGDEPWRAPFKLEARDLAGNALDTGDYNTIFIHWLYRTRARFETELDATVEFPEIPWRLDRGFSVSDARPNCAPLARFRLYRVTRASEEPLAGAGITLVGESAWRADPLRGSTPLNGMPLQEILRQTVNQGQEMCLAIIGADETGNVQYDPGGYAIVNDLDVNEIRYFIWLNGERPLPNHAVDTSIRLELFHERYGLDRRYRNYGPATRVPLPPLVEACDTRVNGWVTMRALTPTAQRGGVGIIWKFHKDGALVARGVDTPDSRGEVKAFLLSLNTDVSQPHLLFRPGSEFVESAATLGDFDENGLLVTDARILEPTLFMARSPARWPDGDVFLSEDNPCPNVDYDRLGDEGNPPLLAEPNTPSERRREVRYTLTAQTVIVNVITNRETGDTEQEILIDRTPATAAFSVYVRDVEEQVRDEAPVREFGR